MQQKYDIAAVIDRIAAHKATEADFRLYNDWCNAQQKQPYEMEDWEGIDQEMFRRIQLDIAADGGNVPPLHPPVKSLYRKIAVAVAVLLFFSIGGYMLWNEKGQEELLVETVPQPGGNRAVLMIDGQTEIALDEEQGAIGFNSQGEIYYVDGSPIEAGKVGSTTVVKDYTLRTPRGGQYQITLADGTHVWLNAETKIRYPQSFGQHERKVVLEGEAYFEVAKDRNRPFIVESKGQRVEVLGTHFNIKAYPEEQHIETALVKGAVRISPSIRGVYDKQSAVILKPGQLASVIMDNPKVTVKSNVAEVAVAWKNGDFWFREESLASIMKQLSRWYDVDVVFEDGVDKNLEIGGIVSRYEQVSEVLKIMELTGKVHFKLQGRRIIVKR